MKNILLLLIIIGCSINIQSQTIIDQNPKFERSRSKYMDQSTILTQNQGLTIQQTYKAIDDMQSKVERKALADTRQQERRTLRIQSRGYIRNNYNRGYNNNNNNNYNNYGYNNNGQNNGYNGIPSSSIINSSMNTLLIGLTLWYILRH